MKKVELLAPAGDLETLKFAVNNGADAIYVGGELFSARAYAKNFNKEELKKAVNYCHIHNVKLYVAVNTIIFENEIEDFIEYIKYLYEINIDALIMQDIGMISLVHKLFPDFELHASTQTNCHNEECINFLKEIGVKRVVLARELSLEEINNIKTDIELEAFIHGALCVSYSGRCLFSSLNGGRSGNRGKCVGSCRLPYKLIKDGKKTDDKYPLSTKELCTVDNIKEILKSNIKSLKIEGRMKSKHYVGYITKIYRKLIDDYYENKEPKITKEEIINISKLYNRTFTKGYISNDNIYNTSSSNHLGYPLGEIVKIDNKKIHIKLSDNLNLEDGIRFVESNEGMTVNKIYNKKGLLINHANKGEIAIIDNKINLKTKDKVNKTIDKKLLKEIENQKEKKIEINFYLKAHLNKPLELTLIEKENKITEKSIIIEKAINKATTKEEIKEKLSKLGNTPFTSKISIDIDDNIFIPMKAINNLRQSLIEKLIKEKTKTRKSRKIHYKKEKIANDKQKINIQVRNEEQLKKVINKANIIYVDDYNLYKKYKNKNIYFRLPNIMKTFPKYQNENLLVNDLGSIYKYYKNNNIITDYTLNISNSESVKLLQKYNTKLVTLSLEIPDYEILKYTNNTEIIIYGKPELMIINKFHQNGNLILEDKNNKYPIIKKECTIILHSKNIDKLKEKINANKRIILFDELNNQINNIISKTSE